ncbi:3-carboxy-cis,cis-muconate cycloisomerase [Pseudoruegeria aquimaris]|uniref:3-carboxy-cis,cis-muconate cycloisomerase n=1 Tax=Pseudoruegeria aquimaris TaxID=393663 RepID=A0A1Y5SVM1_9RHOB|nr:lyase family protein [Pseudoruegeria aquimaris]SLN49447.1 3-carboxy-cis,cis-muconate cycloisomerase [Pseudoruegeria aquimaris]
MAASVYDSAIYRDLFLDAEAGRLFSDSATVRAMMIVEGALAKAQGACGVIPEDSAFFIHRASLECQIDPAGLAAGAGQSAVVVPALVEAFRKAMDAPEHAQYVHWGATSQDIQDTGLILRLRQLFGLFEARLEKALAAFAALAEAHADLPMAARTFAQIATPTSFGAQAAEWGAPLLSHRTRLAALRAEVLKVSLSGAAGTLSAMGDKGPEVRAKLAEGLALGDPGASWHSQREGLAAFAGWMAGLCASLAKFGEDLTLLNQGEVAEITLPGGGASSTMPQKHNPTLPMLLVALGRSAAALNTSLQEAAIHRQQRDPAAWMLEWMFLPQLCLGTARALAVACELAEGLRPNAEAMAARVEGDGGLGFAEALSFALARSMPRPEAQAAVKALCAEARTTGAPLRSLAAARWPELDLDAIFTPAAQMGTAPRDARAFAQAARDAGRNGS